jgi:hypothetical protein
MELGKLPLGILRGLYRNLVYWLARDVFHERDALRRHLEMAADSWEMWKRESLDARDRAEDVFTKYRALQLAYAKLGKENARLRAENERLRRTRR